MGIFRPSNVVFKVIIDYSGSNDDHALQWILHFPSWLRARTYRWSIDHSQWDTFKVKTRSPYALRGEYMTLTVSWMFSSSSALGPVTLTQASSELLVPLSRAFSGSRGDWGLV